jgi:predicted signal transduction protein with EAL and GGDEF domain/DNA-binding response OmpR family regulator
VTTQRKVLLAEDDPVSQLVTTAALEGAGFAVIAAGDGAEALRLFAETGADCVILDLMMHGVDGYTACRLLRTTPAGAEVPVLVLTAHGEAEAVSRAYDAGANDFLVKGGSIRLLVERLRFLLREHDQRHKLRVSQDRLRTVQTLARIGHWELDPDGGSIDVAETVRDLLGPAGDGGPEHIELLRRVLCEQDSRQLDACLRRWRGEDQPFRLDCRLRSGGCLHVQGATTRPGPNGDRRLTLAIQDVTSLREAQHEAHRLAFFDPLSGLPNRHRFIEAVHAMIAARPATASPVAVMVVRVRGAERVLGSGGLAAADHAILAASRRLRATACGPDSPDGTLAHFGGGVFALALPDCGNMGAVAATAEALLAALRPPVAHDGWSLGLVTQVGISVWPQDAGDAEALVEDALAAAGGVAGGSGYAFFSPQILARAKRLLEMETALHGALERNEFRLVFQPRVTLGDLRIVGAEALLRWRSGSLGEVPPAEFIPVAEQSGMIDAIGAWVIDRACAEAARWRNARDEGVVVSVNVSAHQLASPGRLVATVQSALSRHGLPASALELELTESMMVDASSALLGALRALRRRGIAIALDDFGTGYSSLGCLRKLPIDCLKIDRSFVGDLGTDSSADSVLDAVLGVAMALRLHTVAEGIETDDQLRLLVARGCREGQGNLFSGPLEPAEIEELLAGPGAAFQVGRTG